MKAHRFLTVQAFYLGSLLLAGSLCAEDPSTNALGASPMRSASPIVQPETHVLQVGDRLSYRVVEDREDTRLLPVTASGEIEVPYLGKVVVAGKTVAAAAKEIKTLLEKDLYYKATVVLSVEEVAPKPFEMPSMGRLKQISVVGQVRSQGVQDMPRDERYTLSRAIIKAGGFSSFANGRKVQVVRKDAEGKTVKLVVDILSVLKEGKIENDIELLPDDMIIVPEKLINF
ncbi:MAG: polysaccharide biosynthesis/export family protein [Verrucomicrobiae bacterium]|nr:polysaccharide biosynthesis/export family protein [Verrucomicrobiae bacterium]